MGSCYSRQSQQQGKYSQPLEYPVKSSDNHSAVMPHPTAAASAVPAKARATEAAAPKGKHSGFGFRMPYVGRHNNNKPSERSTEQPDVEERQSTASSMSNGIDDGKPTGGGGGVREPLISSAKKRNRMRDKGRRQDNGFAASSESLTSVSSSSGRGKGSRLPSSKQSSLKRAYVPRSNTGSWRMIDDSSSAHSGKSGDKLQERRSRSQNTTPGLSLDDLSNGNVTTSSTPVKTTSTLIKAPIAVIESLETLSGASREDALSRNQSPKKVNDDVISGNKKNRPATGPFQSRLKGRFMKYGSSTSLGKPVNKQANQLSVDNQGSKWVKAKPDQSENATRNICKGTIANRHVLEKQKPAEQELPQNNVITQNKTPAPVNGIHASDGKTANLSPGEENIKKELLITKEQQVESVHQNPTSKVPAVSPDALETISIGSIHSDDLMLDIDLDEYEELGSPPTAEPSKHSRTRSRSRSRSRDNPHRKSLGGGGTERPSDRCDSGIPTPQTKLTCIEPLKELATLVQVSNTSTSSTQRRQQRRAATRPASFPGPPRVAGSATADDPRQLASTTADDPRQLASTTAEEPRQLASTTVLKPPRQSSVNADVDDTITIDGFTYRHLVQDVTNFKTMLLKLKRVIQEDEFHGQKNGFKLSSSQPTSPYDDSNKYSFAAYLEHEEELQNNSSVDDLIKENTELKLELQGIRHQVEEQERTIMLLQQQMTKYECGYSEPGGKAYTHVSTQTDKQVSGFYKTGSYRSACVRRSSSTSSQPLSRYGNRTEFREKSRNSITDEVFMDLESCDNDDDLDLLMEEVSLGSFCLSSVGDNFSQCDERSMSVTSVHPRESFSRKSSITTNQEESSHNDTLTNNNNNILSQTDEDVLPNLKAPSTSSEKCVQPEKGKSKINCSEVKETKYQDLKVGYNENTEQTCSRSADTILHKTDQDSFSKEKSVRCDDIELSEGRNSHSVCSQRSSSVQSNYSVASTKARLCLQADHESHSLKQTCVTDSEPVKSSVEQLDNERSNCGDVNSDKQQEKSAKNSSSLLIRPEAGAKTCLTDNKQKRILQKQERVDDLEDTKASEPSPSLQREPKLTTGLKMPSGRITNWSNSRSLPSSNIPPPRPTQPPVQPAAIKQSQSADRTKFGLHSQSSVRRTEAAPPKAAISKPMQRPSRLMDHVRKHRQLPSLASIQQSPTNLTEPRACSRLPRVSSVDSTNAASNRSYPKNHPVLRGRAK